MMKKRTSVYSSIISEVLGATKTQVESENGEENLTQLYTKALHDLGKTRLRGSAWQY